MKALLTALVLLGVSMPPAAASLTVKYSQASLELVDMTPDDGIAPWVSFSNGAEFGGRLADWGTTMNHEVFMYANRTWGGGNLNDLRAVGTLGPNSALRWRFTFELGASVHDRSPFGGDEYVSADFSFAGHADGDCPCVSYTVPFALTTGKYDGSLLTHHEGPGQRDLMVGDAAWDPDLLATQRDFTLAFASNATMWSELSAPIPEPASFIYLLIGLPMLCLAARRLRVGIGMMPVPTAALQAGFTRRFFRRT